VQTLAVVSEHTGACPDFEQKLLSPLDEMQKKLYTMMGKPAVRNACAHKLHAWSTKRIDRCPHDIAGKGNGRAWAKPK
jgi:hypothetical protein